MDLDEFPLRVIISAIPPIWKILSNDFIRKSMLELNQRFPMVKTPQEKMIIERQIRATDREIDKLVYELYELSEEEIRIVENDQGEVLSVT